jgi:hypothetical protein
MSNTEVSQFRRWSSGRGNSVSRQILLLGVAQLDSASGAVSGIRIYARNNSGRVCGHAPGAGWCHFRATRIEEVKNDPIPPPTTLKLVFTASFTTSARFPVNSASPYFDILAEAGVRSTLYYWYFCYASICSLL